MSIVDHTNKLKKILLPIEKPLENIENRFKEIICSENSVIQEMIDYLFKMKGKRIRPALIFIASKIWDSNKITTIVDIALSVELIHMATLIHDDVNDHSYIRRGMTTYNMKWGNSASVLFGDFLFSNAYLILNRIGNHEIIKNLSITTSQICEGEIIQNLHEKNFDMDIDKYLKIIKLKTASLIAESCRIGAIISEYDEEKIKLLYEFGLNLGMAFQIFDDYLDFKGESELMGKPVLSDILNGYCTLPLIHLFNCTNNKDKNDLVQLIDGYAKNNDLKKINDILDENQSLVYTLETANFYIKKSQDILYDLNDPMLKQYLIDITEFITNRQY